MKDIRAGCAFFAAILFTLMLFPSLSGAAPGDLDTSFGGGDGIVITTYAFFADYFNAVAVQPDGKIVAAGYTDSGSGDILLARFNSDGTPDTSFGTGGVVTTAIGSSTEIARAMALQSDGKIVLVGQSYLGGQYDIAVLRYNSDGSLDTTFGGGDGIVTTNTSTIVDNANAVAIDPSNGNIWVGGTSWGSGNEDFLVLSYDSSGNLNGTFGGVGYVRTNLGGTDRVNAIIVQSDGRVVVTGSASALSGFVLVRYNSNGTLDTSFDTDGIVSTLIGTSSQATSLILLSDGRILAGGFASVSGTSDFALAKYNSDGSLDSSFGSGGTATTPIGSSGDGSYAIALQADGKIIMVGYATGATTSYDFALARFNSNGTLDASYGNAGTVITPIGVTQDIAYAIALQADGKAVVAGYLDNPSYRDSVIARYLGDPSTPVPALSEWGMIIFVVLSGLGAVYYLRRRKTAKS